MEPKHVTHTARRIQFAHVNASVRPCAASDHFYLAPALAAYDFLENKENNSKNVFTRARLNGQQHQTFSKTHAAQQASVWLSGAFLVLFIYKTGTLSTDLVATAAQPSYPTQIQRPLPKVPVRTETFEHALTTEQVAVDTLTHLEAALPLPDRDYTAMVKVEANDHRLTGKKGINNLRLLITNRSKSYLSNIQITLQYLNARDKIIKTQNLSLKSLPPGNRSSLNTIDSRHGRKIIYKVTHAEGTPRGVSMNYL